MSTYLTDERLKSYLDTNQLHREQMCLAILSVDKRFSDLRPRHPRGGPDGGRDIEGRFLQTQHAFGAVGFVNQADDSKEKKSAIQAKFSEDLSRAMAASPCPSAFFFLTNVNFTIGEKDDLVAQAKAKGLGYCEVFDRERLRIVLDSADGFAIRFQYLSIPLSDAEQASFFAKWGDGINSVIGTGFQRMENALNRVLFFHEALSRMTTFVVAFELDRVYSGDEIGHFRAFCSVYLKEPKNKLLSFLFGATDKSDRTRKEFPKNSPTQISGIKHGISGGQWEEYLDFNPVSINIPSDGTHARYQNTGTFSSIGKSETSFISAQYNKDELIRVDAGINLIDINEATVMPIVNFSLASKIRRVHVFANEYKLLEFDRDEFSIDETEFSPDISVDFSEPELLDKWVRIRPKQYSAFALSFSDKTPQRMFVPEPVKNSLKKT